MSPRGSVLLTRFGENAALLHDALGITPLLYGSLGLETALDEPMQPDDIDILIPGEYVTGPGWPRLRTLLEERGYVLTDLHEHTFRLEGVDYAYASLEELEPFAGIAANEIGQCTRDGTSFLLLSPAQYLRVYERSVLDGYRIHTKEKQDHRKIAMIREALHRPL